LVGLVSCRAMPRPTPSLGLTQRCRENRLLSTDRGDEALSLKQGEHGADFGESAGFGSNPMTTRGDAAAAAAAGGDDLSFSLGFSGRGENSWLKFPDPKCDTLAVRVNARGLFPVMSALPRCALGNAVLINLSSHPLPPLSSSSFHSLNERYSQML
jgi:hypothetical protein